MSATTTPTTFSDLYTDAGNRLRVNTSDTTTLNLLKRYINQGLHDVHIQQNWPWSERYDALTLHAPYSDGTVTIDTSTRTTVTGSSTLWNTAVTTGYGFNNVRAGGKMTFAGGTDVFKVSSVTNDTSLSLFFPYVGDALSGETYSYFEDEYSLASDFWRLVDTRKFSDALPIPIIERQEFYRRYVRNSVTGTPRVCTIIDIGHSASVTPQIRVVFHPAPDRVIHIPYRYITTNLAVSSAGAGAANLSSDTDEPIIPLRYRHCLIFYAISQWYRDRKDDARSAEANGEYVDLVKRMAGDVFPEKDLPRFVSNRRDYALGAGGYGRRGRYSTGTAFDELRDW